MSDLTQSSEEIEVFGEVLSATPWQFKMGPITPAILVFVCLAIVFVRLFKIKKNNPYNIIFIYFLIVSTLISFWFGFPQEAISRFITDAKVPMFFCIGLVIFSSYYNRFPNFILITCQIFIALAAGNFIWDILKLFFDTSAAIESVGYKNLSLDSGKGLITVFFFLSLAFILEKKHILWSLVVILITLYILFAYQTRWLVLTLVFGVLLVGSLLGFKRVFILTIPLGIFLFFGIPIMIQLAPEVWNIMVLRFSFIGELNSNSTLMDVEAARAGSIYNSTHLLLDKRSILTGMGYGSWYTDSFFPMPNLSISAFDEDSLTSGKYYRVHDFMFHFLFKFGILGLVIYLGAFLKPLRKIWKIRRFIMKDSNFKLVVIVLYGLTPMAITFMWWTGKGLLFCSYLVVILYEWGRVFYLAYNKSHLERQQLKELSYS